MNKWLEKRLKELFHANRKHILDKMIAAFEKKHPTVSTKELREKFEAEADRVYAIVDRSILRDRIQRAKYTFWATGVASVILIGLLGGFTSNSVLPFITPVVNALISWLVSVATISISYKQRIKGGLDSVVINYEKSLLTDSDVIINDIAIEMNHDEVVMQSSAQVTQKLMEKINSPPNVVMPISNSNSMLHAEQDFHSADSKTVAMVSSISISISISDSDSDDRVDEEASTGLFHKVVIK